MVFPSRGRIDSIDPSHAKLTKSVSQSDWSTTPDTIFNLHASNETSQLLEKVSAAGAPLLDLCEFCLGLTPYDKHKGHTPAQIEQRVFHSAKPKGKAWKPLLEGADIARFMVSLGGAEYINYGSWLGAPREPRFFCSPRILVRQIISGVPPRIYAGYTENELYNTQVAFNLLARKQTDESLKYILAILNSRLMTWFHRMRFLDLGKTTFQKILIQDAKTFPIHRIDFKQASDTVTHDRLVELVDKMLKLTPALRAAKSDAERTALQNAVTKTDREIDQLVYALYGLTPAEIALVEGTATPAQSKE